ncbi:MAG: Undecaprenyl-phosphate galactosephosphotransferase [Cytophagales bacterium]|jgi:undecaprenyl phosphate N,N'-diacetylbacillosamine 1-phosphate transferase|nr:sugar transferase [Bacteroidota bacterium]WHZ08898.1 MAG: Undecaprenyl-phosphate galactosephosphotransferase [Cytophagales bacterium]
MKSAYVSTFKRPLDILVCLVLFVLTSWLLILISLVYLFTFQFPVLFKQERIGLNNQTFVMYKFRTLASDGAASVQQRRFWLGDFLRFFSLDELPQLWNVWVGEMSLIGPRPLPLEYLSKMNDEQKQRHLLRPGITGLTQVSGRHALAWEKKFDLDRYYVHHVSLVMDLKILLKTIVLLVSMKKDQSLEEKKFEGNP